MGIHLLTTSIHLLTPSIHLLTIGYSFTYYTLFICLPNKIILLLIYIDNYIEKLYVKSFFNDNV